MASKLSSAALDGASAESPPLPPPPKLPEAMADRPTACIVVGMAGSGKTTLMQRLNHYAVEQAEAAAAEGVEPDKPTYYVNLDPAVKTVGVLSAEGQLSTSFTHYDCSVNRLRSWVGANSIQ
jgi:ABC-type cobalamin/Fe3+-siderophores transport system ATPase subunit